MSRVSRRWWVWAGFNVAGMAMYLWLASDLWVRPGEEGLPGGPGDAFYWFFVMLPILAGFLILEAATLLYIVIKVPRPVRRAVVILWLVVVGLWGATLAYDHHRGVRAIDAKYARSVPDPFCPALPPGRPPAAAAG